MGKDEPWNEPDEDAEGGGRDEVADFVDLREERVSDRRERWT
jgi:hypothetical protein